MKRDIGFGSRCSRVWGLFLLLAAVAHGDARESYKLGVEAVESTRWSEAARFFRAAIDERPEERSHLLPARRYFPHYYLGVALAEDGNCREALGFLEESERQGKIQKQAELFSDLRARIAECRDFLARLDASNAEVDDLLEEGASTASTLAALSQRPVLAPLWAADTRTFASRQRRALDDLEAAGQQAAAGHAAGDLAALGRAEEAASAAIRSLKELISEAREEIGDLNSATAAALESLESGEKEARKALREIADLAPFTGQLGQKARDLERLVGEIQSRKEVARERQLQDLEKELDAAVEALHRATRRPPRQLQETVVAFLEGKYQEVLDRLADSDQRYEVYVCPLRSASRYALWILQGGGEEDEQPPAELTSEILTCSELEPVLPERFLSPRFRQHFAATVAAALAAEAADSEGAPGLEDPSVRVEEVDLTGGDG